MPAFSGVMWKHFASVLVTNKGCKCTENKFPGNERTSLCKYGHADVVALLLDWDIDVSIQRGKEVEYVNSVNVSTQATPLHFATHSNSLRCVKALLLRFADATLKDNDGRTCLDLAAAYEHEQIVTC